MKVAGLFAGIGGIELGLEQAGLETSLLCEVDPRARAVLSSQFAHVRLVGDVSTLDQLPRGIDVLTAGFPCQDLSQAGNTSGIHGRRSGLVRNVLRLISRSNPTWVLLENVPFLLRLHGGRGIAFITRGLEQCGFRWAYRIIDTQAFGIPHRRERVFLLASREFDPAPYLLADEDVPSEAVQVPAVAHGFYWTEGTRGLGWAVDAVPTIKGGSSVGIPSPPAIWFPDGRFCTPDIRDAERLQGFPVGWTRAAEIVARSSYRWTLVGNAVSVPVARWIGRRLLARPSKVIDHSRVRPIEPRAWPRAAYGGPGIAPVAVAIGSFPVWRQRKHLHEFLRFEAPPLSRRAASGFLSRLQRSSLSRPREFDQALTDYLQAIV